MIKFIKYWLPVLICMGIIFYFSSIPGSLIPSLFKYQDILLHLSIYFTLAYFFSRALKNTYIKLSKDKNFWFTVIFSFFYGILDEFHQIFVPQRFFDIFDIFINTIGIVIGSLIYLSLWQP